MRFLLHVEAVFTVLCQFLESGLEAAKLKFGFFRKMAEASAVAPNAELLDWPKKDKRRFLHAVYRVGDLDRTIEYAFFLISFSDISFFIFCNRGYLFFEIILCFSPGFTLSALV